MRQVIGIIAFLGFAASLWIMGDVQNQPAKKRDKPQDDPYISIATGGLTGIYYPVGGAMCRLINRNTQDHHYQCSVESTGGTVYNLNALSGGEFDFAIAQSDLMHHAYHEHEGSKSVGYNPHLRTVLTLYTEPLNILARDKDIVTFKDLQKKRVNIGAPGSGQRATMQALIEAAGFTKASFGQLSGLNPVEQTLALCDEKVDAIAYVVGNPNGSIQEACSTCDARLVTIDDDLITRLLSDKPYYFKATIPQEMYKGTTKDIQTFGVKVVLTALDTLDNAKVKALVEAVVKNFETFKRLHPVLGSLTVEDILSDDHLVAPHHEGVKAYLREHKIKPSKTKERTA